MTEKRFHWDWKTGRMKDTYSNSQATKNMRLIERQINDACRSYEKQIDKLKKENEQLRKRNKKYMEIELLKSEDYANCHNCKHNRSVHDGVALDGMCSTKGLMNLGGYFDTEYHNLPNRTICPYWELEE